MRINLIKKRIIAGIMCVLMTMSSTPLFAMNLDLDAIEEFESFETIDEIEEVVESYDTPDEFIGMESSPYEDNVEASSGDSSINASYIADSLGKTYGKISANYIWYSPELTVGTKVDVYYKVSDVDTGSIYYEDCDSDYSITEADTLSYTKIFDDLNMNKRNKVTIWYTKAGQEAKLGEQWINVDAGAHSPSFTITPVDVNGKLAIELVPNRLIGTKEVAIWVRKVSDLKYTKYLKTLTRGSSGVKETLNLDLTIDYGSSYSLVVLLDGVGESKSNQHFEAEFNPKIDFNFYSKDGIGFFDVAYLFRLNPSTDAKKNEYLVSPYYYKTGESRVASKKFPDLILNKNNSFELEGTSNPLQFLEPNTDYTVEFDIKVNKASAMPKTIIKEFTTKNYVSEDAKVMVYPEMDSASFDFEIPAGLTIDEKYVTPALNRMGYLFVKKKDGTYSSTPSATMNLVYSAGKWTANDVKVSNLLENETYAYKLSFVSNGATPILLERDFTTAKEPRTISINSIEAMYGGFSVDLDVTDDIGEKMEVDDLFFAVKYPDSLDFDTKITPKYVPKEKKYVIDVPVDPLKYSTGDVVQYKAYFYDPSKLLIETGIVQDNYIVPVDDRVLTVKKEKTYIDAHVIDLELAGLKSFNSYLSYFARKKGGEWKNIYVFALNKKSDPNKEILLDTQGYEVGDEIEYIYGYADDFTDAYNPDRLYGSRTGSFIVLSDDRGVAFTTEPKYEVSTITFNGKITGVGRYRDYDYIKIFYREKGDSDTYSNLLVTLYPDEEEFEAIIPDLLPNTAYEYVIGVVGYANATVDKIINTPIKGEIKTKKDENSLTLSVKPTQPNNAVTKYNVNGATVEIMYTDVTETANKLGLFVEEYKSGVNYFSSDSKVATVNRTTGVVSIKKPGIVAITAKYKKKSGMLVLKIVDYSPILQSSEIRIYQSRDDSSAFLGLIPQNGAEIEKVEIQNNFGMLAPVKKDDKFYIKATGYETDTTEAIKVVATMKDESVYTFDVVVKVDVSVPDIDKFTVKQRVIPNVFYGGDEAENAEFIFKSSKYRVESVKSKKETDIYQVESYDTYTGKLVLSAKNLTKDTLEKFKKGDPIVLSVKVKDYAPVDMELTVKVIDEKPIIRIDEACVTEALGEACVAIYNGKKKLNANLMTLNANVYEDNVANVTLTSKSGLVKVKLNNATAGAYKADVSMRTWTSKVVIEGKVRYFKKGTYNKLKMIPSEKNLTINTNKTYNKPAVFTVSVKGSEKLPVNLSFVSESKDITVRTTGTNGIEVRAKEKATGFAKITVNGAYAGEKLKPIIMKVKLTKDAPSVSYSRKGKINIADREGTYVTVKPKFKNVANDITVARVAITAAKVTLNNKLTSVSCFKAELEDGEIHIYAKPGMTIYPSKKYQVTVLSKLSNGQSLSNDVMVVPQNARPKLRAVAETNKLYKTNKTITADYYIPIPSEFEISDVEVQRKRQVDKMADNFLAVLDRDNTVKISLKNNGARLKYGKYTIPVCVNIKDADNKRPIIVKCPLVVK